jgi:hypothetical protein
MEDTTGIVENELCEEISKDGENLTIIARKIEKAQWELSVKNRYGVSSVWLEYFVTVQQAIDMGIKAIRDESVEPFASTEGFEYLHDENA